MAEVGIEKVPVTQRNIELEQTNYESEIDEKCQMDNDSNCNVPDSNEDVISPLQKTPGIEFPSTSHARKRSVLKREDRQRLPGTEQKRVSFSSGPSERRVSNGRCCLFQFCQYSLLHSTRFPPFVQLLNFYFSNQFIVPSREILFTTVSNGMSHW